MDYNIEDWVTNFDVFCEKFKDIILPNKYMNMQDKDTTLHDSTFG